jgi:hypothetical protein
LPGLGWKFGPENDRPKGTQRAPPKPRIDLNQALVCLFSVTWSKDGVSFQQWPENLLNPAIQYRAN